MGGGGRSACRAAVRQMGKSVCVDHGGDEGVGPQGPVVAVPIFVAVVGQEELHLWHRTSRSPQIPTDPHRRPDHGSLGKHPNTNPPVRIPASAAAAHSLFAAGAGEGRTQRGGRRRERRVVPGGCSALWTGTRRPKLLHTNNNGALRRRAGKMIIVAKTPTALHKVDPWNPIWICSRSASPEDDRSQISPQEQLLLLV